MMKNIISKYSSLFLICTISAFLGGCEGGTGDIRSSEAVDSVVIGESLPDLSGKISNVSVTGGSVTVDFSLQDKDGNPVTGQKPSFGIAQLQEATIGEPTKWQNYINKEQTVGTTGPGTPGTTSSQGSVENSATTGILIDHGDGSYTYTYALVLNDLYSYKVVLNNITSISVNYNPSLTHRVAIQVGGHGHPAVNLMYDFRPAGGIVNTTRKIVKVERCNDCHGELQAMHGGSKVEVDYCVVCHNPGSGDPNSENNIDFTVMMHKLHLGKDLPSVKGPDGKYEDDPKTAGIDETADNGEYAIYGFRDSKHDYSDLALPMDTRNCRKCHDENDADTPDANQWQTTITIEACGSCHDGAETFNNTTATSNHLGTPLSNTSCIAGCHEINGTAGSVEENHVIDVQDVAKQFRYNILDVYSTAPGEYPRVVISVTDPTQGSFFYNITSDTPFTDTRSSLNVKFAWSTTDYANTGTDSYPASPISTPTISGTSLVNAIDNLDGTYTVTSVASIPAAATGSGSVFIDGTPRVDINGKITSIPVKNTIQYFPIDDTTPYIRRKIVDIEKCYKCHESVAMHGANRSDNIEVCVTCHNSDNTDINIRSNPAYLASGIGIDDKKEESIQFGWMIHAIHAGFANNTTHDVKGVLTTEALGHGYREKGIVIYGHKGSINDYSEVRYPDELQRCTACHEGDSYALPVSVDAEPVTFDTGASISSKDDDILISPEAASCYACHDNAIAQGHMEAYGGDFGLTRSEADNRQYEEVCASCHGPGGTSDLKEILGL